MALLSSCHKCGELFDHSASEFRMLCRNCDGTKEREAAALVRWNALSNEEKIAELLRRVEDLENKAAWDGRIG